MFALKSFENCCFGNLNFSYNLLTDASNWETMCGFKEIDPAFWEELSGQSTQPTLLKSHNVQYNNETFLDMESGSNEQSYDSAIPVAKVMDHVFTEQVSNGYIKDSEGILAPTACSEVLDNGFDIGGQADQKECESQAADAFLQQGKRMRIPNQYYAGKAFCKHCDSDDWEQDGEDGLTDS